MSQNARRKRATILDVKERLESVVSMLGSLDTDDSQLSLGELPYRVMHVVDNPAQRRLNDQESEVDELKKENERLKARINLLEAGCNNANVTRQIDDAVNSAQQVEVLAAKVAELKRREAKILDSYRRTSKEFREVCYLLTGYRVDGLENRIYRLSSMYAEREQDKLLFEISPHGELQLLSNEYSDQLSSYVKTYLEQADSFPAFLAAITLDLFKSSTQMTSESMCMSETVVHNPATRLLPESMCMSETVIQNPNHPATQMLPESMCMSDTVIHNPNRAGTQVIPESMCMSTTIVPNPSTASRAGGSTAPSGRRLR